MNLQGIKKSVLPEWFLKHPTTKAILEEASADILKQRQAAKKEVDRLRKDEEALSCKLQAATTDAKIEFELWENHRQELFSKHGEANRALREIKAELDRRIQKQEQILKTTYDERIDFAIEFFGEKLSKFHLSSTLREAELKKSPKNPLNHKQEIYRSTNHPAIMDAINYSRLAIEELEGMKFKPEFDAERIETLKMGIPRIDIFVETELYGFSVSKPLT